MHPYDDKDNYTQQLKMTALVISLNYTVELCNYVIKYQAAHVALTSQGANMQKVNGLFCCI